MLSQEIRETYRDFFVERGHRPVPSDSLIPKADPSLLFTNAGMNQFKAYFLGQMKDDPMKRATTHQKCFRSKDIENVGHTAQHHTFFEMLGNFSFGDYFKKQIIPWAWELVTERFKLPKEKLWITVYLDDDEAAEIWHREAGVSQDRILRFGKKENFWSMGDTGPCGPCSEIHIDLGIERGCGRPFPECDPSCSCDRFSELWNLVFMQFDRQKDGSTLPLPRPSIDTGMGLERLCRILQNRMTNYETDLFQAIIAHIESLSDKTYNRDRRDTVSMRVIADHARGSLFLISDGVTPSNVGRGYVLRRIIRRAIKSARLLGIAKPFMPELFGTVSETMQAAYPEVRENLEYARKVVGAEENRFSKTLERGMSRLVEVMEAAREDKRSITGEEAFNLYDTFGFPLDLTLESAHDEGIEVDREGFDREMNAQRAKARETARFVTDVKAAFGQAVDLPATEFLGYETEETTAKVLAVLGKNGLIEEATPETEGVRLVLDRTPFYAESGGQIGDRGIIRARVSDASDVQMVFRVTDTQKTPNGVTLHAGKVEHGTARVNLFVDAEVDRSPRSRTRRNHTATHLLQAALREVLGDHVRQSGSKVDPDGFRFDFTHFEAMTSEELDRVEEIVVDFIYRDLPVVTEVKSMKEAAEEGALAFFEEKYGDTVRVIKIGDISMELCGGTHCSRTAEIGLMKVLQESSIAAGIRRIEAVTGQGAYEYLAERDRIVREVNRVLKTSPDQTLQRIEKLQDEIRKLNKELESSKQDRAGAQVSGLLEKAETMGGATVLVASLGEMDPKELNTAMDQLRDRVQSGVAMLCATSGDKISFVCSVTKDLIGKIKAGDLVGQVAKVAGGGGGGRPDRAQAGGRDLSKMNEALETARRRIKEALA